MQPTGGEKNAWHLSLRQRFALTPPSQREARRDGFPRQCAHWLGMTALRAVRADRVVRPLQNSTKTGTAFSPSLTVCVFYTYRWVVTSNTPRVVMRRLGITGSAMKLSVMNGSMPVDTPSS